MPTKVTNMAPKRKITVDLPGSRKSRDRNDRAERPSSESKNREHSRNNDKERAERNDRNLIPAREELSRSGDRERMSNKARSSGNTSTNLTSERNTQSEHDRDRSGDSQQHRASVFSRLGKGPVGGTNSSKTSTTTSQKGICRPWAETGQCPYGNECRFKHVSSLVSPSKRSGTSNEGKETKDKERESGSRPMGHR